MNLPFLKKTVNFSTNLNIKNSETILISPENIKRALLNKQTSRTTKSADEIGTGRFNLFGIIDNIQNGISGQGEALKKEFKEQMSSLTIIFIILFVLIAIAIILYVVGTILMCRKINKHIPKGNDTSYIVY